MSNIININNFIDVSTVVTPSATFGVREWGNVLFVQKKTEANDAGLVRYDSLSDLITGEGSNSEAAKYATVFYGSAVSGLSPNSAVYVGTINESLTDDIVIDWAAKTVKLGDATAVALTETTTGLAGTFTLNNIAGSLEVNAGHTAGTITYGPNSGTLAVTASSSTDSGTYTLSTYVSELSALMSSEDYYYMGFDATWSVAELKAMAAVVQATQSQATHKAFVQDYSADAVNLDILADTTSVCAYVKANSLTSVASVWSNPANTNKYYTAAVAAYFATRTFDSSSSRLGTLCFKVESGIQAVDVTDAAIYVSPQVVWNNLKAKNANAYINVKAGNTFWQQGNLGSGDDISAYITADYITYMLVRGIYNLVSTIPDLPMDSSGAASLARVIESVFVPVANAGMIGSGTSDDGESFSSNGFNLFIPIPTGANKQQGLWSGILVSALLTSFGKKIVIGNSLKK